MLNFNFKRNTPTNLIINDNLDLIFQKYNSGDSFYKIAKDLNINEKAIYRLFEQNGIKSKNIKYNNRYKLNETYFDKIDIGDKAYILGLLWADGNHLLKENRISIELNIKDIDILHKISNILFNENIVKITKKLNKEYCKLVITNKHMSESLNKFGFIERKSKIAKYPKINSDLDSHFIRGIIDGDGWIYIPKNNRYSSVIGIIGTIEMNNKIKEIYKKLNIKSYLCVVKNQKELNNIIVKNYKNCSKLINWLYNGSNLYLDRKYRLSRELLEKAL